MAQAKKTETEILLAPAQALAEVLAIMERVAAGHRDRVIAAAEAFFEIDRDRRGDDA